MDFAQIIRKSAVQQLLAIRNGHDDSCHIRVAASQ
jgi:hypothetical protein